MKVLFVSDEFYARNESYNWTGYANRPLVQSMPCEVIVCCTAGEVRAHASSADVVLLEGFRAVSFRDELLFLNDLPLYIAAFYTDVWRGPHWCDSAIRIDLNICVYRDVAEKSHPKFRDSSVFFWAPPRVDVFDYDLPRDIDVIFWGSSGREYPFRSFVQYALINLVVGSPRRSGREFVKVDSHLTLQKIALRGKMYTWGVLLNKRLSSDYHGPALFELLHRCKLCPTGPPVVNDSNVAVARYIENAACGVVSVTSDLEDKEGLGLRHSENIWFTDAEHFISDMVYLLEHDDVVSLMSQKAKDLVRSRHTVAVRAQELYNRLCDATGKE
jgi:hypothetical protein